MKGSRLLGMRRLHGLCPPPWPVPPPPWPVPPPSMACTPPHGLRPPTCPAPLCTPHTCSPAAAAAAEPAAAQAPSRACACVRWSHHKQIAARTRPFDSWHVGEAHTAGAQPTCSRCTSRPGRVGSTHLAQVGGESDHLAVILLLQPLEDDGGVQAAAVGENHLVHLRLSLRGLAGQGAGAGGAGRAAAAAPAAGQGAAPQAGLLRGGEGEACSQPPSRVRVGEGPPPPGRTHPAV